MKGRAFGEKEYPISNKEYPLMKGRAFGEKEYPTPQSGASIQFIPPWRDKECPLMKGIH